MSKISETETVVKKIIPYLVRRGYDVDSDFTFEYPTKGTARHNLGFVDILVRHSGKIAFLVEAKRIAKTLSQKDRDQAVAYGRDCKASFVVLTNGSQFESINSTTGKRLRWNSKLSDKVPSKSELAKALTALRKDPTLAEVSLEDDQSLPFRPGLPLKQLNALFSRCHNTIRKIERNEDNAFSDFAKLLFLKLLEEKADSGGEALKYSYRFHELAQIPENSADQVKTAVLSMLETVKSKTLYGDVIHDRLHLNNSKTFKRIVSELSAVSFRDIRADSKGAAFEYFVRATLKGKRLGQYFTPRPLIEVMHAMIGDEKVLNTLSYSGEMRVVDPACGTGGFLVYLMVSAVEQAQKLFLSGKVNASRRDELIAKIKKNVFFGADAHEGVASSAKMNMIIAGDGHSNIQCEDSLSKEATIWSTSIDDIDLIITNPPFGTSETESLRDEDFEQFVVGGGKGQLLFLQKMVQAVKAGGEICTVIDEGLLNTDQAAALRSYLLENTIIRGIVRLPDVTFKPNKINVRASVLHMIKRDKPNPDKDNDYPVFFLDIEGLGYQGSGETIRNFDFRGMVEKIAAEYHGTERNKTSACGTGAGWRWFTRSSVAIAKDPTSRFDFKYWDADIVAGIEELLRKGGKSIKSINMVKTKRGRSPNSSLYVDEADGYALVIKAGTNITKQGTISREGDFVEKSVFDDHETVHVKDGDVLLSSTGDGTLGKCAVYRGDEPAMFDGHVTLIRVNQKEVWPEYLCDFLRAGFGADQIARLYTGSTGLIELPPDKVDSIIVPIPDIKVQKALSAKLRAAEATFAKSVGGASEQLQAAIQSFKIDANIGG